MYVKLYIYRYELKKSKLKISWAKGNKIIVIMTIMYDVYIH